MADVYKDFQREPSRAHQCMHESEKDGTRCRAMAMQNNYMCYAHRTDDVVTVIENDMFLIDNLDTHAAIQKAFCDVAARLACNPIDLPRAARPSAKPQQRPRSNPAQPRTHALRPERPKGSTPMRKRTSSNGPPPARTTRPSTALARNPSPTTTSSLPSMPFGVFATSSQLRQNRTGTERPYQPTPSTHPTPLAPNPSP